LNALIGPVPDNWREVPLGEVCDVIAGPSANLMRPAGVGVPVKVVAPKNLEHGRITGSVTVQVTDEASSRLDRYRLAPGDLICVRTGDLSKQVLVDPEQEGWVVGNACFKLRPRLDSHYLLHYLAHPAIREWIGRHASTATVPTLTLSTLRTLPVLFPPQETQVRIGTILGALDDKAAVHREIVAVTEKLRDSLFPVLLGSPKGASSGPT